MHGRSWILSIARGGSQLWTLGIGTYTEAIRQPVFLVLLLLGILLLALNPAFTAYTLEDDNKLLLDLGLSTIFLAGLFLSAFTTAGVLDREIRNRTVTTVLSRPVSRPLFLLGKFLGVVAAVATAFWIWSLVFLLAAQHGVMMRATDVFDFPVLVLGLGATAVSLGWAMFANFRRGRVFSSAFTFSLLPLLTVAYLVTLALDESWGWHAPALEVDGQILIALLLLLEALAILSAVAVAASTRLGQMATLTICTIVLFLGLAADSLFGRMGSDHFLARIGTVLVPDFQFLWLADALTQERTVSLFYVLSTTGYALAYITAVLAFGVVLFQNRDVG